MGDYVKGFQDRNVSFGATSAGTCDVTLVFATGFTYSTDVTFTETNHDCPDCPSMLSPSPAVVTVQNPSSTCMAEGGADASVLDASLR